MRRRITVALVAMVAGALVLAGAVALLLTVRDTRNQTRAELLREAQQLPLTVRSEATTRADPARALLTILTTLKSPLRLQGEAVLAVRPDGTLFDPVTPRKAPVLPTGLSRADVEPAALAAGKSVSGTAGSLVYAAVPYDTTVQISGTARAVRLVVILTRQPPTGLRAAGPWLLASGLAILALSVVVAYRLGRRFVRPLRAVETVTGRIAAGDLTARVPQPAGADAELASLAASVNAMADALARARGAERQFLLSISHDLRTPLTSIRGFAEAIEDGAAEDTRRAAGVIASEARRLERLIRDLLDLANLQGRRFSLDLRPVDLAASMQATAAGFAPAAAELNLVLTAAPASPEAILVWADPDRLAQVTANLVENALKFARSTVHAGCAVSEGQPVLWVDDDGPGIAAVDVGRVFDRSFASANGTGSPDRTRRAGRSVGSGLGLAIVAELVAAMGGSVRAESPLTTGGGTRMVVTLRSPDPAIVEGAHQVRPVPS